MKAMIFSGAKRDLEERELPTPEPTQGQVQIRVKACGVCRTDLHVFDGELPDPKFPLVLGHQIVGEVTKLGPGVDALHLGQRVGVPWLGGTCGACAHCASGSENLCDEAVFTGYQVDGGFAEFAVADASFCFPISEVYSDAEAAPLLCAGLIGYRALRMAGEAGRIGLYGFGSAAHIAAQVSIFLGREVYAFTKPGDEQGQGLARELGAVWAGDSTQRPEVELDAAILFAPVGALVPTALRAVRKGGVVVCAGIHMSDIPAFSYDLLWGERVLRSVANLTRQDGIEFLDLAPKIPIRPRVQVFSLQEASLAMERLRQGKVHGSAVLELERSV